LADFLPVYDKLNELQEKNAEDEFGRKYGGLSMGPTFTKMGVKEYAVEVGATLDNFRMAVVESEHSSDFDKGTVIRPVAMGMELEGNVIRAAECVASLGAEEEKKPEEKSEDDKASEDEAE
jgi:molecular chaperone GrpE (heat shock protein)